MSNLHSNGSSDSRPGSKGQDKIQTRQTTLEFKNRRQTVTPYKSTLSLLHTPYEDNTNSNNELINDIKIKKKTPSSNINGRKGSINNGGNGKEGGISLNKRKEDCGDGGEVELEITEIKSKKIKMEAKEEEECFIENIKTPKMTELQYNAQMLNRLKSVDQGKTLPPSIDRPYIHKIYHMPREKTKVFWILPNSYLNYMIEEFKKSPKSENLAKIKSESFRIQTELEWRFVVYYQVDKNKLGFMLKAQENDEEKKNPDWKRYANFTFSVFQTNCNFEKNLDSTHTFVKDKKDIGVNCSISNFDLQKGGEVVVETNIKMNNGYNYDSKEKTGYVGLINAGNTCYMNSFLQTLFNLSSFTRCVLRMPIKEDENISMQAALQQVFYNLKYSNKAVATNELLKSFGWESREAWVQHDVQEFKCLLLESIEEKMSKSPDLKGEVSRLFGGILVNYVECIKVDYKSSREEKFYDVQLNIKESKDIYESLEKYTEVEILDGDNLYDCEKLGKQEAKKGTTFKSLPPVLFFQLIRFEYDPNKDLNVKITSRFEYGEHLDLNRFVTDKSKDYTYRLFSVLVHSGEGSSSGHYYAFIRPKMGQWLKFNDDVVEKAYDYQVYNSNFGGTFVDAKFNKTTKIIEENEIKNITTAYMLIYLREDSIKDLLKEVKDEEIPQRLREIDLKLQKEEEEKKRKTEQMKIYFTSFDILQENYLQPGLIFFRKGMYDEIFRLEFIGNKKNRYKRWINKTVFLSRFLEDLSEEIGLKQQEFMIYKVQWAMSESKTKVTSLNRYLKSNNGGQPCGLTLKNAYLGNKNPATQPLLLILPILTKDKAIFEPRKAKKTNAMIDEKEEKNEIEFIKHQGSKVKNPKISNEEVEELYNNLVRENYFVIFFKKYKKEENCLNFFAYEFFDKNMLIEDIQNKIQNDYDEQFLYMTGKQLTIFRETYSSTPQLEDLQPKLQEKIGDYLENGTIIVVDDDDRSVEEYYQSLEDKAYVTFISQESNNQKRSLLKTNMTYTEIISHIQSLFDEFNDKDPEKILLKVKGKKTGQQYIEVIETEDKTLEELIKFEDKILVEPSIIKISDLESKFLLKIVYCFPDNTLSQIIDFSLEKSVLVKDFLRVKVPTDEKFLNETNYNPKKNKNIRLVVLDTKRVVTIAQLEHPVHTYVKKGYNLRLEEDEDLDENEEFYIYCSQFTKTSELIPHPFLLKASKTDTCNDIRQKLIEALTPRKFEFEKKAITMSEEYFNKLKLYLKFDVNTSLNKAIVIESSDKEFYSLKKNQDDEDKFFLDIIHNSLVSRNSTKALKIN